MERQRAEEQLATIAEARAGVADHLITPWWYHPILGLLLAGLVVAYGSDGVVVKLVAAILFGVGCGVLVSVYRRLTGLWVSGLDAGGASVWATSLGVLAGVGLAVSWGIAQATDLAWPAWGLAALVLAGTIVMGRRFDAALREQLRAAP
jgi:hypothetical protein